MISAQPRGVVKIVVRNCGTEVGVAQPNSAA
jgi:hypothetical protein